jgi:hypothetical protein
MNYDYDEVVDTCIVTAEEYAQQLENKKIVDVPDLAHRIDVGKEVKLLDKQRSEAEALVAKHALELRDLMNKHYTENRELEESYLLG